MSRVKVSELRQNLPEYLARVREGQEIEVTVHGRVIARIVPEGGRAEAARERLKALRAKARVGDVLSPSGERWNAERGRS
jgi:prevent-host-death family protein